MQWWLDPLVTASMLLQLLLSWQQSLHLALCIFASTVVHSHEIFSKLYEVSHILAWIFPRIDHQQALLEPRKEKTQLFIVHIIPYSYLSINIILFHFLYTVQPLSPWLIKYILPFMYIHYSNMFHIRNVIIKCFKK